MPTAARTCVSGPNFSQISKARLEVASSLDASQVPVVAVGADDVLAFAKRLVREHGDRHTDRADGATVGTEDFTDLLRLSGREVAAERREELHLAETVVAADEREQQALVGHDRHRLRGRALVDAQELRDRLDRALPRRLHLLRGGKLLRKVRSRGNAAGDLEIGCVVAVLADDERVLARSCRCEEVPAAAAAHDPGLGRHLEGLEAAALEDALVGLGMLAKALVEPGLVAVEGVGVLHDELAKADQTLSRPWLVALLDREVVEDLRQLPVALQLASVERDSFLVG